MNLDLENTTKCRKIIKSNRIYRQDLLLEKYGNALRFCGSNAFIPCEYMLQGLEKIGVLERATPIPEIFFRVIFEKDISGERVMCLEQDIVNNNGIFIFVYGLHDGQFYVSIKDFIKTLVEFKVLRSDSNLEPQHNYFYKDNTAMNEITILI